MQDVPEWLREDGEQHVRARDQHGAACTRRQRHQHHRRRVRVRRLGARVRRRVPVPSPPRQGSVRLRTQQQQFLQKKFTLWKTQVGAARHGRFQPERRGDRKRWRLGVSCSFQSPGATLRFTNNSPSLIQRCPLYRVSVVLLVHILKLDFLVSFHTEENNVCFPK